jgi:hypothetical protein
LSQSQPRQSKLFQAFQSLSKKNKGKKKGFQGKKTLIFLDFLGFLRAIRAFSMRYSEFPIKIFFAAQTLLSPLSPLRRRVQVIAGSRSFYPAKDTTISDLL